MSRTGDESTALVGLSQVYEKVLGWQFVRGEKPDRPHPDRERQTMAPDVLLWTATGSCLAIEHTRFLTLPRQAKMEAEFAVARRGLEARLVSDGRFTVEVSLRGQSVPQTLAEDLCELVERVLPGAPDGTSEQELRRTGLHVRVRSERSRPRRLLVRPLMALPPGRSLDDEAPRMQVALAEAVEKFRVAPNGARRVVLFHCDDFANVSADQPEKWLRAAFDPDMRRGLDDVWWVDTYFGRPAVYFYSCLWSALADPVGHVFSGEWTSEDGVGDIQTWAPGRPWWRAQA